MMFLIFFYTTFSAFIFFLFYVYDFFLLTGWHSNESVANSGRQTKFSENIARILAHPKCTHWGVIRQNTRNKCEKYIAKTAIYVNIKETWLKGGRIRGNAMANKLPQRRFRKLNPQIIRKHMTPVFFILGRTRTGRLRAGSFSIQSRGCWNKFP